jgi:hypothetical protein
MSEPFVGWRHVEVTKRRRKQEFVAQMQSLVVDHYPDTDCIRVVVVDNLNTHQRYAFTSIFHQKRHIACSASLGFTSRQTTGVG